MQVAESCELVCDVDNIEVLCEEYQKTDTIYQLKIQVTKFCACMYMYIHGKHIIPVLMIRIENCLDTDFSIRNSITFPLEILSDQI